MIVYACHQVHFTLMLQHLGPGGQRQQTQISSRVPIEFLRAPGVDVGTLKQLIAQYAEPAGLLTGPGSFTIRRLYSMTQPQNAEGNEQNLVPWLLRLLDTGGPLAVGGDLLRNVSLVLTADLYVRMYEVQHGLFGEGSGQTCVRTAFCMEKFAWCLVVVPEIGGV